MYIKFISSTNKKDGKGIRQRIYKTLPTEFATGLFRLYFMLQYKKCEVVSILKHHSMKMYAGMEVKFQISALDRSEWLASL
jgi:hypothetical protein